MMYPASFPFRKAMQPGDRTSDGRYVMNAAAVPMRAAGVFSPGSCIAIGNVAREAAEKMGEVHMPAPKKAGGVA